MAIVLKKLIKQNMHIRFHTPNALHVREISPKIAELLYLSGFKTIRLGLETADIKQHDELDKKISEGDFERAVTNLKKAGFKKQDIGAYMLMGLPGQSFDSVVHTIKTVGNTGATPHLAEYSPLPHTSLWEKAIVHSDYDIQAEPLYHNNSLLPCWDEEKRARVPELKKMVNNIRQDL